MRAPLLLLSIAGLVAAATPGSAQHDELSPPYSFAGGNLMVAQPTGEFADQVDTGFGLTGHFLYRPDPEGIFGLRVDGGYVNYGRESRAVPLSPTVGGRITVDLVTSNDILFFGVGPQLGAPGNRIQPYLNGSVGVAYFVTGSSLRGDRDGESFANTTNFDDVTLGYGAGAGIYVPVRRGYAPISLDLGIRYHRNGTVDYLREGAIRDNPDGSITVFPIRSEADLLTFQVGVSAALRSSDDCEHRSRRDCRRGRY